MTVPIENGKQVLILATSSVSIFLATLAVGLRIVAKCIGFGFDWSDFCILAALFFNTALHTCCMLLVTHGGFGFHTVDIYQRFGPDTATFFFKGILSFSLLWNATVCFSKLSVLLMYTTLIPIPSMIRYARIVGGLIILWIVIDVLVGLLICRPLAKNWDFTLEGTCGSQPNYYFAMGIVNLITDAVMIALPIPYLLRLSLAMRKRILAIALLSIGVGTWVITIYRQTLLPGLDFTDMTYTGVVATILSGLEPSVALALACIPLMRPLFGRKDSARSKSAYDYNSNKSSGIYSRKEARAASRDPNSFTEIVDDNDDSSEIHLQPIKTFQNVNVTTEPAIRRESVTGQPDQSITVEKRWEVRHH